VRSHILATLQPRRATLIVSFADQSLQPSQSSSITPNNQPPAWHYRGIVHYPWNPAW
jgi:hypothetical protein